MVHDEGASQHFNVWKPLVGGQSLPSNLKDESIGAMPMAQASRGGYTLSTSARTLPEFCCVGTLFLTFSSVTFFAVCLMPWADV